MCLAKATHAEHLTRFATMSSNNKQQHHRSILKTAETTPLATLSAPTTSPSMRNSATLGASRNAKWDESNIRATFHPADKDYGHIKVDEPKTPFVRGSPQHSHSINDTSRSSHNPASSNMVDAEQLSDRIELTRQDIPKAVEAQNQRQVSTNDEDQKRRVFEERRKQHYNEFQKAKILITEDEDEALGAGVIQPEETKKNTALNSRPSQNS